MQNRLPTEERQAEIVAAALRLARDSSPVTITTGDIAAAIGITQGAVFKHFPTKDAIWVAAMTWGREQLLPRLADVRCPQVAAGVGLAAVCRGLEGAFTLVAMHVDAPETLVAARRNSPLVVGIGEGEMFVASDVSALTAHTRHTV